MSGRTQISRRTCLRGIGIALALPLLETMSWAGVPAAGRPQQPTRLLFLNWRYGMTPGTFWPKDEKSYGPSGALPPNLEPLRASLSDCLLIGGIKNPGTFDEATAKTGPSTHAVETAAWLTCMPPLLNNGICSIGISADQIAAEQIGQYTALPSLELGVIGGNGEALSGTGENGYSNAYNNTISYRSATQPLPRETDPRAVLKRLFSSRRSAPLRRGGPNVDAGRFSASPAAGAGDGEHSLDQTMLDMVMDGAKALRKHVSSSDQHTLDEYLEGIGSLEKRIVAIERQQAEAARQQQGARSPRTGTFSEPITVAMPKDGAPWSERFRVMADLIVLAFQSDVTRVISLGNLNSYGGGFPELGILDGHHSLTHNDGPKDAEKYNKVQKIEHLLMEQIAYVVQRVKGIKDGNGTLLDHSILLMGSGMRDGASHKLHDFPTIIAGGGNGTIRSGRYVSAAKGTHGDLLIGILARAGCTLSRPLGMNGSRPSPDLS